MSLEPLRAEGVELVWKAWRMPSEAAPPAKPEGYGVQAKEALARIVSDLGLTLQSPSGKRDTLLAHIGAKIAREQGKFDAYHRRIFEAIWKDDLDVGDPRTLRVIAQGVGMGTTEFLESLEQERYREMVEADFWEAEERKIWTIPSYIGRQGIIQVHHFQDIPNLQDLYQIL